MAFSMVKQDSVICNDFTKCSICFEDFKSPKCLPCSHSFCHECLKNHIESSCRSKEAPVGFSCPLCRDFIPAENISAELSNWANDFPSNDRLGKISEISKGNLSDGCLRDGEEEEAKQFCLMCKEKLCGMCTKYHRRNFLTKDHEVLSLGELKMSPIVIETKKSCFAHAEKIIKYYCQDHSVPCCTVCVCSGHRKCDNIETVTETADRLRTKEHDMLCLAIGELEKEMTKIKTELDKNISDIEEKSESLSESAEELYSKIQKHIEKIKNEYLQQLSEKSKECKGKLQENSESLGDKIEYLKQCRKSLSCLKEKENSYYVREFHETRKKCSTLRDLYSASRRRLNIMEITSNFDSQMYEGMNYLGNVYVRTVKSFQPLKPSVDSLLKREMNFLIKSRKGT